MRAFTKCRLLLPSINTCLLVDRYIYAFPDYWSWNTQKNTNFTLFLLCSVFKYILEQIGNFHNLVVIIEGRVSQDRELGRMGDFTQYGTCRCPFRLCPPLLPPLVNVLLILNVGCISSSDSFVVKKVTTLKQTILSTNFSTVFVSNLILIFRTVTTKNYESYCRYNYLNNKQTD